jgi:DNA-3-methyladenine glycosylase
LTNGPGKLTQALGIGAHHNGLDLEEGVIGIGLTQTQLPPFRIDVSRRIGITRSVDLPFRFTVQANAFLSQPS